MPNRGNLRQPGQPRRRDIDPRHRRPSEKSVLALDDAGHDKVGVVGLTKYRHQVSGA